MKISNKYINIILAISVLLNVIAGFYVFRKTYSEVTAKREARIKSKEKQQDVYSGQSYLSILNYDSIPPQRAISRTTILNTLIERYNYQSYLEIGQGLRTDNFDFINCKIKIGVDPEKSLNAAYQMTSDEFFALNNDSFDLIFIDGLHHAFQVEKDILNALNVLNKNGTIVVHDCNPTTKEMQIVPRQQAAWTGDVWKTWAKLRATRHDLKMYVINASGGDTSCGIIRRGTQLTIKMPEPLTYEVLDKNREKLLNLVDINDFLKDLKSNLLSVVTSDTPKGSNLVTMADLIKIRMVGQQRIAH